jgi:hypothetical protein
MRRVGLLAGATLAAIILGTALVASGGAQQPGERTFKLIEQEASFGFVDNPPRSQGNPRNPRISAGDVTVFTSRLFNEANQRAGALFVDCTAVRGGRNFGRAYFQCEGTYRLADGTLTAVAAFRGSEGDTLTITIAGGTGAYEGARGSIASRPLPRNRTESTVHLLP